MPDKKSVQREMVLSLLIGIANTGASRQQLQETLEQIRSITLDEIMAGVEATRAADDTEYKQPMTLAESIRRKIEEAQAAKDGK